MFSFYSQHQPQDVHDRKHMLGQSLGRDKRVGLDFFISFPKNQL